jgi:hypothetical protein
MSVTDDSEDAVAQPTEDQASLRARGELVRMAFGHMTTQVLATTARLGLMDVIGEGERSAAEVAGECGANTQAMYRLLRALAALGLLVENTPGSFSLTPAGSLLRTDRRDSVRTIVEMFADPEVVRAWERLEDSLRTGRPSFVDVYGTDFFTYLKQKPDVSAHFNAAMSQGTRETADVLPKHYHFSRFKTVVDVGGGDGTLLAAILREHPTTRGVVFDTPEGLSQAGTTLEREGLAGRFTLEPGDFFASVPAGGDLYLLKSVIHDWDDEKAATILRNCRDVVPAHGRLLIIEPVFPSTVDGSVPPFMYLNDLNMLVKHGGCERTRTDYEELCRRAGFTVTGITPLPTATAFSIVEAEAS